MCRLAISEGIMHQTESYIEISGRIDSLRRCVRRLFLLEGLAKTLLVGIGLSAATFLIDWLIPDIPGAIRLLFLSASLVLLAFAVFNYIAFPLRTPISNDDIAIHLEKAFPHLNGRLISSIQLPRQHPRYRNFNSPSLISALLSETAEVSKNIDFSKALTYKSIFKYGTLAVTAVALTITFILTSPNLVGIWLARLVGRDDVSWPRRTFIEVTPPPQRLAVGQSLPIEARIHGVIPSKVRISYRFITGESGKDKMSPDPNDERRFLFDFPQLYSSLDFTVSGGDAEPVSYHVEVLPPPRLNKIHVLYDYPDYTGIPDTPPDVPHESGNIEAVVGTSILIKAFTNIPIQDARIDLLSESPQVVPLEIEPATRTVLMGRFNMVASGEYSFKLLATNGLENIEPYRFTMHAIKDTPPHVKFIEPGEEKEVTPDAVLPMRIVTTDDFGIRSINLVYTLERADSPPLKGIFEIPSECNNAPYGSKNIQSTYGFDMSRIQAKEGHVVRYRAEARDYNDSPNTPPGLSDEFRIIVMSRAQIYQRIIQRLGQVRNDIKNLQRHQEGILKDVNDYIVTLSSAGDITRKITADISNSSLSQRRISEEARRIMLLIQGILNDLILNKIADATLRHDLQEIINTMGNISEEKSPSAAEILSAGASAATAASSIDKLQTASALQKTIISDLEHIIQLLEEWETYAQIIEELNEILKDQRDLRQKLPR